MSDDFHILVVGASGRFAADSTLAAGYAVSVVDLFNDLDTRRICEKSGQFLSAQGDQASPKCLRIESLQSLTKTSRDHIAANEDQFLKIEALNANAVIFTGGAENYPEFFSSHFFSSAKPLGPAANSIERLLSLVAIEKVCRDQSIQRPRSICSLNEMTSEASSNTAWLQKQIRSGGGLQVRRWDRGTAIDFAAGNYLQEFVEGDTISGCYVCSSHAGQTETLLLGGCIQHPNQSENDFRYRGSVGPIQLTQHERYEMNRTAQCIAAAFGLMGVFGIDFVRGDQGLYLVDINPRIPSSAELIERSRRMADPTFTIVETHLNACLRSQLPDLIEVSQPDLFSKSIIYLPADQRLKVDAGLIDYFDSHSHITDLPVLGSEIEPNHPFVTVHAEASDPESLNARSELCTAELLQQVSKRLSPI